MLTHAVRDRAPVDHVQGPVQPALAAGARRRRALVEPVHRDHAEHQRRRDRGLQPGLGQPASTTSRREAGSTHDAPGDARCARRCGCSTTSSTSTSTPIPKARRSNLRHRPVGLGVMGFQDALYMLGMPLASRRGGRSSPTDSMEADQLLRDLGLGRSRGRARTLREFEGSLWSQGMLPIDSSTCSPRSAAAARGRRSSTLGLGCAARAGAHHRHAQLEHAWRSRRPRPSPTSAASRQSIEPMYQNLFVKSNMSGEFTVVNAYLVRDLKELRSVGRGHGRGPEVLRRHRSARSTASPTT